MFPLRDEPAGGANSGGLMPVDAGELPRDLDALKRAAAA
jgi:hypothetical protein